VFSFAEKKNVNITIRTKKQTKAEYVWLKTSTKNVSKRKIENIVATTSLHFAAGYNIIHTSKH